MKNPPGPEFQPEDADRLIAAFNRQADPEKRQALDETLLAEKKRFEDLQRERNAERLGGPEQER